MKKQTFKNHFNQLVGYGNPIAAQAEIEFQYGEDSWKIWLVIKQDQLKSFHFNGPKDSFWTPFFSLMADKTQDLSVADAFSLGWSDIKEWIEEDLHSQLQGDASEADADDEALRFLTLEGSGYLPLLCLPAFMMTQALVQYLGGDLTLEKVKGLKTEDIVCHCFGTTKAEIKKLVAEHPEADLAMINGKLLAGTACGDCQDDCLSFLNNRKSYAELVEGTFLNTSLLDNYQGKNQYDFLKLVAKLLNDFEQQQGLNLSLGIANLRDRFLTLDQQLEVDLRKSLEQFLFERTGFKLFISF